jgi:hypothetical protein
VFQALLFYRFTRNFVRRKSLSKKFILALLPLTMLAILATGCGTTRQLQSITASATPLSTADTIAQTRNLFGVGGSEPIFIIAHYSGGDSEVDVTGEATFVSSNPGVVTVSKGGILEVVGGFCDWVSSTIIDPAQIITVTATFKGQTTIIMVNVNSLAGCPGPTAQQ